jgi:hypothetical protein
MYDMSVRLSIVMLMTMVVDESVYVIQHGLDPLMSGKHTVGLDPIVREDHIPLRITVRRLLAMMRATVYLYDVVNLWQVEVREVPMELLIPIARTTHEAISLQGLIDPIFRLCC